MKNTQKVTLVAMLALLAGAVIGFYITSDSVSSTSSSKTSSASKSEMPPINQRYLDTALRLAYQAATPEEQHAAKDALDAADHELDLEYAYSLQLSTIQPVPETPAIRAIEDRIAKIDAAIQARQTEVDQLNRLVERARGARRNALKEQLNISVAELNLSKEALADAKSDLTQAGGDPNSRLQELKVEHEAASKAADTFKFPPLPGPAPSGSLLAKWSRWKSVHQKQVEIRQAQQEGYAFVANLTRQRDALEKQVASEQTQRNALAAHELTPEQIAGLIASPSARPSVTVPGTQRSGEANSSSPVSPAVILIQSISSDRARLRILGGRIRAMNEFVSAYANWGLLAAAAGRRALHSIITDGLWIVLLMVFALLLDHLIGRFLARLSLERKQRTTLQSVFRVTVQLVIVLVTLLMIFGRPNQLSTVLGLAGAGLAIALQAIILSFLGWFVLMGRHGIHVGDWVEINSNAFTGVRGEVIEITLFRTVLLETGNWTEPSHPTGRQVAFMNMYAVTGYYFNFTTSGQWLWDELQVLIPASQNPFPLVQKIRAIVAKETASYTQSAKHEWEHVSRRYDMRSLSAEPTVNLRLTDNGVIAVVRYITRADERTAVRYRMDHEIVTLFHNGEELVPEAEVLPSGTAPAAGHR
jgi:small-conductance mechanosensitive channel